MTEAAEGGAPTSEQFRALVLDALSAAGDDRAWIDTELSHDGEVRLDGSFRLDALGSAIWNAAIEAALARIQIVDAYDAVPLGVWTRVDELKRPAGEGA